MELERSELRNTDVELRFGVKIRLRDGIHLDGTLYISRVAPPPVPCVIALTPYGTDGLHDTALYFSRRGFPFLAVDVRGRGNSEGSFSPHLQEANDGHDVVEWVAEQSYCCGKVAMWGGSYLGYCQWATAKELPPHLATIVPMAAPCRGVDVPMRSNIFTPYIIQWLALVRGRTTQRLVASDSEFWLSVYRQWYETGRSFRDLDAIAGTSSPMFQEWLSHPIPDAYWDLRNPTEEQYARIEIPILTITGCYDDDQPGALAHYKRHTRCTSPAGRSLHYLLIGPWDHGGIGRPGSDVGGVPLGEASRLDMRKLHFEWYQWTLKGGEPPASLKGPVTYYVMGAEKWRSADSLEEVTHSLMAFFLDSEGYAGEAFSSGVMRTLAPVGKPDSYTYDPGKEDSFLIEAERTAPPGSLIDEAIFMALRGRQLVYYSEPFEVDTEVSGFFRLSAWIAINTPDTDLYVTVHEICADGTTIRLSRDAIRARYRKSLRTPSPISSDDPLHYDFDGFTFVSRVVKRGHRLRLVLAPVGRLVDGAFSERNFNGGGVVAEEDVNSSRPVTVTLFHDSVHPSELRVPLGKPELDITHGPPLERAISRREATLVK